MQPRRRVCCEVYNVCVAFWRLLSGVKKGIPVLYLRVWTLDGKAKESRAQVMAILELPVVVAHGGNRVSFSGPEISTNSCWVKHI